jgi:hypothetical protein
VPNPPEVAQLLLHALLPVDTRETVSGDLLEEYRDSRVPAAGELRADLWYWRQVGGIWLRAYWWLVVPVVLLLVVHDVFNTFRAPSGASYLDGLPKFALAVMPPLGVVGLLGLAAAYGSWRTQRWQGGFVAALGVSVIVWLFGAAWLNATFYPFAQVQQSNPYWVGAWHWSTQRAGTPEETFVHWLYWDNVGALIIGGIALLVTSFVWGGIGAIFGEIRSHRRRVAREES